MSKNTKQENIECKNLEKKSKYTSVKMKKGITLIALVVTIVVLLILAGVSITVVFGDNGIIQLAKEAGEKTNEAVQNDKENIGNMTNYIKSLNWDTSKVTAVTTKDGGIVPVPKGFVASEVDGENTIESGFVIYEGENPVTNENVNTSRAREERNQFVWIPADGVSLEYKQDKESWKDYELSYYHYTDWTDDEELKERQASVEKYGGFYVGRYEAGLPESNQYENEHPYQKDNRNINTGTPVVRKGYAAWNLVNQINAKTLSQNMYGNNDNLNSIVESRLIDSYAWDTICHWFENSGINITDSTSWGNYINSKPHKINGLYAIHTIDYSGENSWTDYKQAEKYLKGEKEIETRHELGKVEVIELATGIDEENKANNIYDFAGNMWELTTEEGKHGILDSSEIWGVIRGCGYLNNGINFPVVRRHGYYAGKADNEHVGFRSVLYIK